MATVVNNPGDGNSGSAGWAVAVVILLVVLAGAFFVWGGFDGDAAPADVTNVDVTVPTSDTSNFPTPAGVGDDDGTADQGPGDMGSGGSDDFAPQAGPGSPEPM